MEQKHEKIWGVKSDGSDNPLSLSTGVMSPLWASFSHKYNENNNSYLSSGSIVYSYVGLGELMPLKKRQASREVSFVSLSVFHVSLVLELTP